MTDRSQPHRWILLALPAILYALPGCAPGGESGVPTGTLFFNELQRADQGPVSEANRLENNARYFSDGGPDGEEVLSELVPTDVSIDHLPKLRRSEVFFGLGAAVSLSYELAGRDGTVLGKVPTQSTMPFEWGKDSGIPLESLSFVSTYGPIDTYSRHLVYLDGNKLFSPHRPDLANHTVSLQRCTDGDAARDSNGPAEPLDEGCNWQIVDAELCDFGYSRWEDLVALPWTGVGCGLDVGADTSFRLMSASRVRPDVNVEYIYFDVHHEPKQLLPHMKRVDPMLGRAIGRPMDHVRDMCWIVPEGQMDERPCHSFDEDPGTGAKYKTSEWFWSATEGADGLWSENFSDQLLVTQVRLFVEDPMAPDGRRFLTADEVHAIEVNREFCEPTADPETGAAVFDLMNCPVILSVTPSYEHRLLQGSSVDEILEWRTHLRVAGAGTGFLGDFPARQGDPFFIQFTLQSLSVARSLGGLLIVPGSGLDFGKTKAGSRNTIERAFRIENTGLNAERIENLDVAGIDAADFELELADGLRLPFTLAAGDSFDVHATFVSQAGTGREAEMRVRASQWGVPRELRVRMQAVTGWSYGEIAPSMLGFDLSGGTGFGSPGDGRIRAVQLASVGNYTLRVDDVNVVGPDADQYTVLERAPYMSHYDHQLYGTPYRTPRVMAPGQFQDFIVVYHPNHAGEHRATLEIVDESGIQETELVGVCAGTGTYGCSFSAPLNAP